MAARPIVASDLPSLRERCCDGENACLIPPDDPLALAAGIQRVMCDPAMQTQLVERAYSDAQAYTWNNRAKKIVTEIERTIHAS